MVSYIEKVFKWYVFYFAGITTSNKIIILLLALFMAVLLAVFVKRKWLTYPKAILVESLFCYLLFVFMSTVFARESMDTVKLNIDIVETYRYKLKYNIDTQFELLLNIFLLLPLGTIFPYLVSTKKTMFTLLGGFLISILIESLQFVLKKGTFELTDVVNNTLGVLLGYFMYILLRRCRDVIRRMHSKKENYHV